MPLGITYRIGDDMTRDDVSVTHHSVDGFTLYALDADQYLVHRRFIGYSVDEAMSVFLAEFSGPDNCPNRLGWIVDHWHECDTCR